MHMATYMDFKYKTCIPKENGANWNIRNPIEEFQKIFQCISHNITAVWGAR